MTRYRHVAWAVLCLLVVSAVHATAPAADELVPEDTCIVELTLPEGSIVNVNGDDYGTQREFTYKPLVPKKIYEYKYVIHYPSGKTSEHKLLIQGGRRVKMARRDPVIKTPVLVLQTGHLWAIICAAISPDGRNIVTASSDETAILWDAQTGRQLRTFSLGRGVRSMSFSPDGRTILTGSDGKTAILWDVQTGKRLRTFEGHSGGILSVAFSPDGRTILTGSHDKTAILWDVQTGRKLRTFEGHSDGIFSVALSPDGRTILTGSYDKTAILWDVQTGHKLRTFEGHSGGILSVAFSPDGRTILTGSWDKTAILWDVQTGKRLRALEGKEIARVFRFSPDGTTVLGSSNKTGIIWDVQTGKKIRTFGGDKELIRNLAISPDGRSALATSSNNDPEIILLDIQTNKKLWKFEEYTDLILFAVLSPDGQTALTCSGLRNEAIFWDVQTGKKLLTFEGHSNRIPSVAFSPDGRTILTGSWDKTAILWDIQTGRKLRTFEEHSGPIDSVAFSPNSRTILTGSRDKTAILWDVYTGKELRTFRGHSEGISSVAFRPDGQAILTGSHDNTAILWDAHTGKKLRTFEGHSEPIDSVAFSPNGRTILTGSWDETAILWDIQTGKRLRKFEGHSDAIRSVAFSPDGRTILTSSGGGIFSHDNAAILWDVQTGRKLWTFEGHSAGISSVAFSPDGRTVLTASEDGSTKFWSVATGESLFTRLQFKKGQDWIITTPDGLFDGSPGGMRKVHYRIGEGLNVVPVERFFQNFYRPGLLAAIMRGERPLPMVEIGKQLPPEVRVVSPKRNRDTEEDVVTIEVVIEDKGGGIKTPWIEQNGSRVIVDSKPVREGNRLRWKFELPLVDGENKIEVQSASADGSWESETARVTLTRTTPTEKTELYLLAIGVSKYADESVDLRYAAADAEAFGKLFRTRGADSYGEGRVHVQTLLDKDATSENIERAIAKIADKAKPQDVFMLTLSGHGIMVGQRYFFLPHEFTSKEEGGWKEDAKKYGLPGDELQTWINRVPALKRVVVYDTCQSGGAIAVASLSRDAFGFQRAFETFRRSTGSYIIAAATATQNAEEIDDIGHGALTYALLAGLGAVDHGPFMKRTAQSEDGLIQVDDWLGFARENVPALTKTYYGQEQLVNVFGEGHSFPILSATKD